MNRPVDLIVFFDGGCPLCRREISLYQRLSLANSGNTVGWLDVNSEAVQSGESPLSEGLSQSQALARFHVAKINGTTTQVLSGAAAFVALWQKIPGWRWLGYFGALPGITASLEIAYRFFLLLRPNMQLLARWAEPAVSQTPDFMVADMRSDHAGETGAVWIYRGILAGSTDKQVRHFARHHLATEAEHLRLISAWLPWRQRSRLLPLWRIAGFLTGFLPALFGARTVYATIATVETFVEQHYQEQIEKLEHSEYPGLLNLMKRCQADEVAHKQEAQALRQSQAKSTIQFVKHQQNSSLLSVWLGLVATGSSQAVKLARFV